jgi:hypothetical protein
MFEKSIHGTQKEMVRDLLLAGVKLTQKQALDKYGIMRLASRIHDVRKTYCLKVQVNRIQFKNRFGDSVCGYLIGLELRCRCR